MKKLNFNRIMSALSCVSSFACGQVWTRAAVNAHQSARLEEKVRRLVDAIQREQENALQKYVTAIELLDQEKEQIWQSSVKGLNSLVEGLQLTSKEKAKLCPWGTGKQFRHHSEGVKAVLSELTSGFGGAGVGFLATGLVKTVCGWRQAATDNTLAKHDADSAGLAVPALLKGAWLPGSLLFSGVVAVKMAKKKLNVAKSNLAHAECFVEEVRKDIVVLQGIEAAAIMMRGLLRTLNEKYFTPLLGRARELSGIAFSHLSPVEQRLIYACIKVGTTLTDIMNTQLLTSDGQLNPGIKLLSPGAVEAQVQDEIATDELLYERAA